MNALTSVLYQLGTAALRRLSSEAGTVKRAGVDDLDIELDDGSRISGVAYRNPAGMRAKPRLGARCLVRWTLSGPYACEWEANAFAVLTLNDGVKPLARENDLVKFDLGDALGYTLVGVVTASNLPAIPIGATAIVGPVTLTGDVQGQIVASQQVLRA